jgi:hypothetical protein
MTEATVTCRKCGKDVPFTNEAWDASVQRCRQCSGVAATSAKVPAPLAMKIVGLDIPIGDLLVLWLKLIVISFFIAIPIWVVLFLLRLV